MIWSIILHKYDCQIPINTPISLQQQRLIITTIHYYYFWFFVCRLTFPQLAATRLHLFGSTHRCISEPALSLSNQPSPSRWQRSLSEAPLACMPVHNNNNNSYFKLGCVPQESLKGGPCNFRLLHSRTFCRADALSAALPAESKHRRVIMQKNLIKPQRSN